MPNFIGRTVFRSVTNGVRGPVATVIVVVCLILAVLALLFGALAVLSFVPLLAYGLACATGSNYLGWMVILFVVAFIVMMFVEPLPG